MTNMISYRLSNVSQFIAIFATLLTSNILVGNVQANSLKQKISNDFTVKLALGNSDPNGFPGKQIIAGNDNQNSENLTVLGYAAPSAAGIGNARNLFKLFTQIKFNNKLIRNTVYTVDANEIKQLQTKGWRSAGTLGYVIAASDRREFTTILFRLRSKTVFPRANGTSVNAYTYISGESSAARDDFVRDNPEWEIDITIGRISPLSFPAELQTKKVGREVLNLDAAGFQVYDCRQSAAPFIGPVATLKNKNSTFNAVHFNRPTLDLRENIIAQTNIILGDFETNMFAGGPWWLQLDAEKSAVKGQVAVRAPSLAADSVGRLLLNIVETRGDGFQKAQFIVRDQPNGGLRPTICPNQDIFNSNYTAVYRYYVSQ